MIKKSKVIISIFAGRMADTGKDPIPQLKKVLNFKKFKNVKFYGLVQENLIIIYKQNSLGCHIITVPPSIIEKIEKFGKVLKLDNRYS